MQATTADGLIAPAAPTNISKRVILTVIVAGLGYFVDLYDLVLFGVYRLPSLRDIGVADANQISTGLTLMNIQMTGMILGGVLWGLMGDRKGRTSILFGSIMVYSVATIANAFAYNIEQFMVLRFFAGLGLAGELGAAVTLISETMSKEKRTYGTGALFAFGFLGGIAAGATGKYLTWRTGYLVGGGMGLALLALRAGLFESGMYKTMKERTHKRGDFKILFRKGRWKMYLFGVLVGVPTWFGAVTSGFAPEIAKSIGVVGTITSADAIFYAYIGVFFGSFVSCLVSQIVKRRKPVIFMFLLLVAASPTILLTSHGLTAAQVAGLYMLSGFGAGYSALAISAVAELFGTNIRSTVATSVPNFIRAATIPMNIVLLAAVPRLGLVNSILIVLCTVVVMAAAALFPLEETFGKNLDFVES